MWSHWICDTISGARLLPVFPASESWRSSIGGVGSGTHAFQLRDVETRLPRATWRDISTTWQRTLVSCWDEVPQYAGLIKARRYDVPSGVLTISTVELRAIFDRRMPFRLYEYAPLGYSEVVGKSLRGVVRQIVEWGAHNTPVGSNWWLPVVLPPDEAGSESRRWQHYRFESIEKLLRQIETADGGPQIHFRPRWSSTGTLEWELRIGTPTLSGPAFEWDATASESGLSGLAVTDDGANQSTGIWALGAGSEADRLIGYGPSAGAPNMDFTRPFTSITDLAQLNQLAQGVVAATLGPSTVIDIGVTAPQVLPGMIPGSVLSVRVMGDEFLNDGTLSGRVVGMSGNLSETIGVELA